MVFTYMGKNEPLSWQELTRFFLSSASSHCNMLTKESVLELLICLFMMSGHLR